MLKAKESFCMCGNLDYCSEIFHLSPTSKEVYSHLINVGLGHVTHFGPFSLWAELKLADLTQVEISNVVGLVLLAFIITLGKHDPAES